MKEILSALSKALNVAESDLSSGLLDGEKIKEGAEKFLSEKLSAHYKKVVSDAKAESKEDTENQVKKVRKETAEKFEAAIKTSVTGIDASLIGDQLIEALPKQIAKIASAGAEDPTKILSSEVHIKAIKEVEEKLKKDFEDKIQTKEKELTEIKTANEQRVLNDRLKAEANKYINQFTLRDDVPATAIEAIKKLAETELLSTNKYKIISDTGEIVVVDNEGKAMKDEHGHLIKIESLIEKAYKPLKEISKAAAGKGDGPGGSGAGGAGGSKTFESLGLPVSKTREDHRRVIEATSKLVNEGKLTKEEQAKLVELSNKAVIEEVSKQSAT